MKPAHAILETPETTDINDDLVSTPSVRELIDGRLSIVASPDSSTLPRSSTDDANHDIDGDDPLSVEHVAILGMER